MATKLNLALRKEYEVMTGQGHRLRTNARKARARLLSVKDLFIEWLATPDELRAPKNQRDFCREHGINEATAWRWKGDSAVLAEVEKLVNRYARSHFADVVYALVESAKSGNIQACRLYLQFIMGWREGESADTCLKRLAREESDRVRPN